MGNSKPLSIFRQGFCQHPGRSARIRPQRYHDHSGKALGDSWGLGVLGLEMCGLGFRGLEMYGLGA